MTISKWIADVGESPNFVAFNAHWGFSFALLVFFPHVVTLLTIIIFAALKEFWFDIKYETNPTQTWKDGLLDFAGYMTGVGLFLAKVFFLTHKL